MEELFYNIGQGIRKPSSFLPRKQPTKKSVKKFHTDHPIHIIIGGERQIPHQMAQCCDPHFPDDIVAVLRTGGKCMIHSTQCRSLERVNSRRLLPAYWQTAEKGKVVSFSLLFHDVPGLMARVTKIFYEMGINIIDLDLKTQNDGTCRLHVSIEIHDDASFLDRLFERIRLYIPEFLMAEHDFFDKRK